MAFYSSERKGHGSSEIVVAAAAEGFGEAAESMDTCLMRSLLIWTPWRSCAETCACGFSHSS
jgi:hypothetical protein